MQDASCDIRAVGLAGRRRKKLREPRPEVRERLLSAAETLLGAQPDADLRIDDVAASAGISVGGLYLYFDGKDDLLTAMVVRHTLDSCRYREAAHSTEGSVIERLERGIVAYVDHAARNERSFLHSRAARPIQTTAGELSAWCIAQQAKSIRRLLEAGMAAGELVAQDLELLTQSLVALQQHLVAFWMENRERVTREQIITFMVRALRDAVEPR